MRIIFPIVATILIALCACSKAAPPQRAEGIDPTFEGSAREKQTKAVEAALITNNPGLAVRRGQALVINHGAREITTYTDDPTGCQRYFLTGVLKLRDENDTLSPVAGVTCHFANSENTYLILPNSDKYLIRGEASASPDGRYLASGFDRADKTQGSLVLAKWPNIRDVVMFPAHCVGFVWQDASHFTATCWHNDGPDEASPYDSFATYFRANVSQDASGKWQMQAEQWVDRDTLKPKTSNKPLYHFTAAPPPEPHFDKAT